MTIKNNLLHLENTTFFLHNISETCPEQNIVEEDDDPIDSLYLCADSAEGKEEESERAVYLHYLAL